MKRETETVYTILILHRGGRTLLLHGQSPYFIAMLVKYVAFMTSINININVIL